MNTAEILNITGAKILRKQESSSFELSVPAFKISKGEITAIVGESGCGKSTLLDFLSLILSPKEVETFTVDDFGKKIDVANLWLTKNDKKLSYLRRKIFGYVPQTGGLLPFLSVRKNLYLPAKLNNQKNFQERIDKLSKNMGIYSFLDRSPQTLSGGQRQRASIIRAMSHNPLVILADEPTAAVDRKRAQAIVRDFKLMAKEQQTAVIMVTHDKLLVEYIADSWYGFKLKYLKDGLIRSVCERIEK